MFEEKIIWTQPNILSKYNKIWNIILRSLLCCKTNFGRCWKSFKTLWQKRWEQAKQGDHVFCSSANEERLEFCITLYWAFSDPLCYSLVILYYANGKKGFPFDSLKEPWQFWAALLQVFLFSWEGGGLLSFRLEKGRRALIRMPDQTRALQCRVDRSWGKAVEYLVDIVHCTRPGWVHSNVVV